MPPLHKVLVIEDHELIATTLRAALMARGYRVERCPDITPGGIVQTAERFRPDVALLDYDLGPLVGPSVSLIPDLRHAGAHVIMLTATATPGRAARCIEAGAQGLLSKNEPLDGVVDAIERVIKDGSLVSPSQRERLLERLGAARAEYRRRLAPFADLTRREQEVLGALMQGSSAQEIAKATFTSVRTVRGHIQSVLGKLGVNSQVAAVAKARQSGWSPPVATADDEHD